MQTVSLKGRIHLPIHIHLTLWEHAKVKVPTDVLEEHVGTKWHTASHETGMHKAKRCASPEGCLQAMQPSHLTGWM